MQWCWQSRTPRLDEADERSVGIIVFEDGAREKWAQKTKVKQRSTTTTNERRRGESDEWDESGNEREIDERERIGESRV